jgi:hypothetical protein
MIVDKTVVTILDRQLCDKGNKKNGRLDIRMQPATRFLSAMST